MDRERVAAKASRSCASVAGHSWLRCGMVRRLATVRWHLPSAVSGAGETVAALAAHIAEADIALAASTGSASSIVVPSSASQRAVRPRVRQENALREAEREIRAHLVEALKRRRAGLRHLPGIAGRGEIAEAQTGIIVAGADDAVEIDLAEGHLADHHHAVADLDLEQLCRLAIEANALLRQRA